MYHIYLNETEKKDKNLVIKFPQTWRHPTNTKFNCYRNKIIQMEFVKKDVFSNVNLEDVDEIIVKASSGCSDRFTFSYSLRLIYNVKIIDERDNKTKNEVYNYTSFGSILFLCRMRKMRHKVIKINKLTLRYCGNIDDLNICYRLKLGLPFSPLEIAFYKNVATNDDYVNNYCVPIQSDFTEKCTMWYLYNKAKD